MRGILAEVGIADALLVRETPAGLQLIDGHLRADVSPDSEWPVLVLDVDDKEAAKLLATFDPLSAMAETDPEKLKELLRQIDVDSEALQQMLAELADEAGLQDDGVEIVEDEVPAPPDEATTRPGDLWILGDHRLLCGDSSKPDDVDRLLDGAVIHLVNTDPPYNVKVEPRSNNAIAAGLSSFAGPKHHQSLDLARHPEKSKPTSKKLRAKDRPLANDFVSDAAFDELLAAWFGNIARVLQPGRVFYIWGGYANCANYPPVLKACELYFSQAIIWVKEHPVLTRKDFMGNHEWCFYGWREGAAHVYLGPANAVDVWSIKKINPQSMVHLTEKPVELAARAMRYSSRSGENVLDLFGGSGSTLMAAEQTGRHAYLMELDPLYCDVIVERWEKFTGQKAERVQEAAT
ncbi:MAG: site-specific DNA-methyltransferase [Pirellulales bacterium]